MSGTQRTGLGHDVRGNGVERAEQRVGVERVNPRRELVEDHAEREHVAGARRGLAARLLGRHVARRAENHARAGVVVAGRRDVGRLREARQPEVEHLHVAIVADDDVLRLDVTVDNTRSMRHREGLRELRPKPCQHMSGTGRPVDRGQPTVLRQTPWRGRRRSGAGRQSRTFS